MPKEADSIDIHVDQLALPLGNGRPLERGPLRLQEDHPQSTCLAPMGSKIRRGLGVCLTKWALAFGSPHRGLQTFGSNQYHAVLVSATAQ
jgi:hypothetical protein